MRRPVPLIVIGLTAIVAAVLLGAVVPEEYQLAVLVPCGLLSLAFGWGIGKLSGVGWLMLPAFMIVIPGLAVLVGDGHRALMEVLGKPETCVIRSVDDLPKADNPAYAHDIACPDGTEFRVVVLGEDKHRMALGPATVLRHPIMRPLLADRNNYSVEWVFGVPLGVLILLFCATGLRARSVMRQA